MHVVLVFRKKIFGYGFECEEGQLMYESARVRDRLGPYLLDKHLPKKCIAEKYEIFGGTVRGFIGFLEEGFSIFPKDLEEEEIGTGKYLKIGNLSEVDYFGGRFCVNKSVQTFLEKNNIRTDRAGFSFGRNSYLRIIN